MAEAHGYPGFEAKALLPKLKRLLSAGPWRAVVIQAGANDIVGSGCSVESTVQHVMQLWHACDAVGLPVVFVINTDCETGEFGAISDPVVAQERRTNLAALAKSLAEHAAADGRAVCDPRSVLKFDSESEHLWDDSIHYSAAGSDVLGRLVAEVMLQRGL